MALRENRLLNLKNFKRCSKENQPKPRENFDDVAQKEFLNGAKIAYETIITDFSNGNLKI